MGLVRELDQDEIKRAILEYVRGEGFEVVENVEFDTNQPAPNGPLNLRAKVPVKKKEEVNTDWGYGPGR
jgi:hypothetical protein